MFNDKKKQAIFFSHLVRESYQVRTVITVERFFFAFNFNALIPLQVDMIQVVASSKERWPGDLLPETL